MSWSNTRTTGSFVHARATPVVSLNRTRHCPNVLGRWKASPACETSERAGRSHTRSNICQWIIAIRQESGPPFLVPCRDVAMLRPRPKRPVHRITNPLKRGIVNPWCVVLARLAAGRTGRGVTAAWHGRDPTNAWGDCVPFAGSVRNLVDPMPPMFTLPAFTARGQVAYEGDREDRPLPDTEPV